MVAAYCSLFIDHCLVTPARIERATYSLEGCCSIQLSYGAMSLVVTSQNPRSNRLTPQSGRQDSNLRPLGPKPSALAGLSYAPNVQI